MAGSFTHLLVLLSIFQCVVKVGDEREEATQELLHQHEEQQRQQMAWLLEEVEEIEQRSQLLDEMEQSSQHSVLLSACQHWWFWALADVLLMVFAFFWLPRQRSSASDSSDTEEPPKEPKSRRSRRRRNRMRGSTADQLDPIRSSHQQPDTMDMQNLRKKHGVKQMISASDRAFPQSTLARGCVWGIY